MMTMRIIKTAVLKPHIITVTVSVDGYPEESTFEIDIRNFTTMSIKGHEVTIDLDKLKLFAEIDKNINGLADTYDVASRLKNLTFEEEIIKGYKKAFGETE